MVLPVTVLFIAEVNMPPMNFMPALPPGTNDTTYPTIAPICMKAPSAVNRVLWSPMAAYRVPASEHRYTTAPGVGEAKIRLGPRSSAAPSSANNEPSDHSRANFLAFRRSSGAYRAESPKHSAEKQIQTPNATKR